MSRKILVLIFALLVAAFVAGCAAVPAPSPVPPTKTPKPTFTPTPDWTPTSIAYATSGVPTTAPEIQPTAAPAENTPEAGATASGEAQATTVPEATATEAAPQVTRFTANQNVNVRSGPGTVYPAIGRLTAGQSFDVLGRNDAGDWIKFDFNGRDGWVTFALVSIEGDLSGVQVAAAPAVPTARPQPTAAPRPVQPTAAPAQPTAVPQPQYPFTYVEGSAKCEPNAGNTYFNGFVRYRNNSPRNGVCVHVAFYGPRQTKCSGCGGVGDGVWGFSPFGGPAPAGTTVEIYVVSCEGVGVGGQDQATGFGDLTPKSNKFVKTINASEQCTGITFVGD